MTEVGERPTARQWQIFGVVSSALMMSSIDSTIVATALPTIHGALHASLSLVAWTLTGYTLGQIVIAPLAGNLGDVYGRRPVFLIALVLFTVSSLLCGFATSVYELILLRVVQAIGGGAFIPCAIGIISETFVAGRARAVGLTSSILPAGGLIGPVLGAVLIAQLSWRWVFFINVPVGAALFVLALKVLPRSERSVQRYRPDVWGVVLLASFMLSIMVATTALAHLGQWFPDAALGFACLACAASARGIVRHSSRRENPLIPMRFVSGPGFRVVNLINVVYGACVLGLATLLPLYAQGRYHLSVLESGALLTARAVGSIVVATAAAFLLERTGYRTPIRIGLAGIALGFLLTAIQPAGMPVLPWLVGAATITGIGFGVSTPAASNAALALAPNAVGVVTGLRGVGRQAGAITAVSIATGVASLASSQSVALAVVFAVAAACVLALLPLVRQLPEDGGQPA